MAEENIEAEVPNPEGLAPGTLGPCSNWPDRFAPPTLFPKWSQELLSPSWKDTLRSPMPKVQDKSELQIKLSSSYLEDG